MIEDIAAFIRANTCVSAPSHVPELTLHLADDAVALWSSTEEELGQLGLPPPFWAFAWAGGQALARYLLDHRQIVAGKRVLDVAAGSGLAAIAAMKAGAAAAVAIDIDAVCAPAIALNAALNGVCVTARVGDPIGRPADAELILVGDLFYDRDLAPRLLAWLKQEAAAGAGVLIGDPGRYYLPQAELVPLAEYIIPTPRALEDAETKRTRVWTLTGAGMSESA